MANKEIDQNLNLQPQSIEAELAVLGAMLSSKDAISKALQWLRSHHFYKESHSKIFLVMSDLFDKGEPIDTISVINKLKKNKQIDDVGGAYFITGLVESVPTAANVESYAKIVLEKFMLRELIRASHELSKDAYNDRLRGGFMPIDGILHETFKNLDRIASNPGSVTGVASGLIDLDEITSGFQKGDLAIIAGRPSMGKTALALSIMRNAAIDFKVPVGMFSLEMANHQLAQRLLCAEGRVDSHLVRTGKLPKNQWKNLSLAVGSLAEAEIYLDDTPAITVLELRAKARRLKAEKNLGLIIIDYLQLMQGPRNIESRQQEISNISRSLKALAKELDIPVIALSQLSRAVEQRSDHRPQLSDLRESGAIEQDADVVIFLYRSWVYSRDEEEKGRAQAIVAKQRNGPIGTVNLSFIDRFARFESISAFEELESKVPF